MSWTMNIFLSGSTLLAEALTPSTLIWQIVQGILMGWVQGLTEFLPISSTAHLILFRNVFGWEQTWGKAAIDAIQFGSVLAVIGYFWKDIRVIVSGAWQAFKRKDWQQEEWKILVGIAIGTVPALAGGLLLKKSGLKLESAQVIAVMSLVMAGLLGLAEKVGTRKRDFKDLEIQDGVLVGLGQMIALLPGASRSGSTLTTALFLGLKRETAARFSFLLGLPTLTIATLVQAKDVLDTPQMLVPLLAGIASAFVFSWLSIAWLLKFLQRQSAWIFVWYRVGLALVLFAGIALGQLQ